ncbi:RNA pyrophosphohydrolase [Parasulfitobacter algicola]|uniref:RNA pyrophosphohydrolase n=1 Tax=Parasulfitobacter algicola TaxID=2614809 RepID=A0ABX2IV89_9RHOB|nr:RNA pyrophosphohydrolase [Sulfitobacter algicola]NSX55916.1 RNA pyrophosphohydrolase [Sulfitobacter algicola]
MEKRYRPCVGIMLANTAGQVFTGQRMDYSSEAWQMPQGGIDDGEKPKQAALRELWEETGVVSDLITIEAEHSDWLNYDLPEDLAQKLWKGKYVGQTQKWFLMRFQGTDQDINIETDHQEFSEWQWMPHDQLIDRIVPFKREIYRQVLAQFASHL